MRAVLIGTSLSRGCCRISTRVRVATRRMLAHRQPTLGREHPEQTLRGIRSSKRTDPRPFTPLGTRARLHHLLGHFVLENGLRTAAWLPAAVALSPHKPSRSPGAARR